MLFVHQIDFVNVFVWGGVGGVWVVGMEDVGAGRGGVGGGCGGCGGGVCV